MIPRINLEPAQSDKPPDKGTKTFYINLDENRIEQRIEGLQAVEQSIIRMLSTERYAYLIFDRDYGAALEKYVGKSYGYIAGDIGREIKEALLTDDRITEVHDFTFEREGNGDLLRVGFVVDTIYGATRMNAQVSI